MINRVKPLFDVNFCSSWSGPSLADDALQSSGFAVHRVYQDGVISFCKDNHQSDGIQEYWIEVAREFLSSGDFAPDRIDRGIFRDKPDFYKSRILEHYESSLMHGKISDFISISHTLPSLHPCVRDVLYDLEVGGEFRNIMTKEIMQRRNLEEAGLNFEQDFHEDSIDITDLFYIIGARMGFRKMDVIPSSSHDFPHVAAMKIKNGLTFYSIIDGIRKRADKFPGFFEVFWFIGKENIDIDRDISLGDMSNIVPGIEYYNNNIRCEKGFALGFSAYFTCAFAIAMSLSSAYD